MLAALMNRYGEDILPEEVAYAMEDHATRSTGNTALLLRRQAAAAIPAGMDGPGRPAHPDPRRLLGGSAAGAPLPHQRGACQHLDGAAGLWTRYAAVLADYAAERPYCREQRGPVKTAPWLWQILSGTLPAVRWCCGSSCRGIAADRPRIRCEIAYDEADQCWYFPPGQPGPPAGGVLRLGGNLLDGVAHATTAHRVFRQAERTRTGGLLICPEQLDRGGPCSVNAVDQTGAMRVAELHLPKPAPAAEPAPPCEPSSPADVG